MANRIFVYGSLRKGLGLHPFLKGCPFIGTFTTLPKYNLHDLGPFPGMSLEGATAVVGEIYEVSDFELQRLDQIEGGYDRMKIDLDNGDQVDAYILKGRHPGNNAGLVLGGDWTSHYHAKEKTRKDIFFNRNEDEDEDDEKPTRSHGVWSRRSGW